MIITLCSIPNYPNDLCLCVQKPKIRQTQIIFKVTSQAQFNGSVVSSLVKFSRKVKVFVLLLTLPFKTKTVNDTHR